MTNRETVREMNREAIKDGLMLAGNKSLRKDFSAILGKPLTHLEDRIYSAIHELTPQGPVSLETLYREIYQPAKDHKISLRNKKTAWVHIRRIREKLGETAIETNFGEGYRSRRKMIEMQVNKKATGLNLDF